MKTWLSTAMLALSIAQLARPETNSVNHYARTGGYRNQGAVRHTYGWVNPSEFILNEQVFRQLDIQDRRAAVAQCSALGRPPRMNDRIAMRYFNGSNGTTTAQAVITNLTAIQFSNGVTIEMGTNAVIDLFEAMQDSYQWLHTPQSGMLP